LKLLMAKEVEGELSSGGSWPKGRCVGGVRMCEALTRMSNCHTKKESHLRVWLAELVPRTPRPQSNLGLILRIR
jgi:hypothetical protein